MIGVAGPDQHAVHLIRHHFRYRAHRGGHRYHAIGHRLQHRHRKALAVAGQHEDRRFGQQPVPLRRADPAEDLDGVVECVGADKLAHLLHLPVTGQRDPQIGPNVAGQQADRADKVVAALVGVQPAQ